ncbi:bacteriophage terminase small subunit [Dysgonomonas sp.]|uniref:bacteriophage terminase small subunit n=1 Tax=Dysgonomonas sp. TaxID=1891233 RepID=UPI0027BA786D|nr:bacteriophage terminase small subunit [Dysgonomonas sp.]
MAKYTERLVERIISFIEEDTYSISEICNALNINRKTFYEWRKTKPEFNEAVERAMECRDDKLLMLARSSLKKKLEGYTLTETRTIYVPDKNNPEKLVLKSRTVRQKEYAPDTHAIKLVLLQNEAKEEKEAEYKHEPALTIVVHDPTTAESLNLLRENLRNNHSVEQKKKEEAVVDDQPMKLSDKPLAVKDVDTEVELQPKKKPKHVTIPNLNTGPLPPGYRYRG